MYAISETLQFLNNPLVLVLVCSSLVCLIAWFLLFGKSEEPTDQHHITTLIPVNADDDAFMSMLMLPITVHYSTPHSAQHGPEQITNYLLSRIRQLASRVTPRDLYDHRDRLADQLKLRLSESFSKYGYSFDRIEIQEPKPTDAVRAAFHKAALAFDREKEALANMEDQALIQAENSAQWTKTAAEVLQNPYYQSAVRLGAPRMTSQAVAQ